MEKIGLPQIVEEKIDPTRSRFIIEPLYPGYGSTLGNSLRRVLLSSIVGAAATSFKVEGVNHEFTSIPDVKEDMLELLMNIKGICFRSFSDEPVVLEISKKGPGEVSASDFRPNSNIEICNPDHHLVSLDKNADFQLQVTVEKDRGFRPIGSNNQPEKKEIGWIGIDASFSPVTRVSMTIEDTRVGQMTNFDKLTLAVSTNGTVSPSYAVKEASRVLVDHFDSIISDTDFNPELTVRHEDEMSDESEEGIEDQADADSELNFKIKIEDASLSPRTTNALLNAGIKTIAGLKRLSPLKLEEIKGLGKKGLTEINEVLTKYE